ncbi:alpha/beta hydrolase [Streptomyces canus]|uniref:alpha/beta hydrolase n=1 Tax=Streptomyces canus TaxID=58343 RepID=UPI0036B08B25
MTHKAATKFSRRTVQFASGDSYCSAWLYLPDTASDSPVPVVVMGHGLGATREMGLVPYAERFAATGLAVLVFTYRNLGDSGGGPRQVLSMTKQLADWDAALEYAAGLPEVDRQRVAVWGSSLVGGHAIAVAARHPPRRSSSASAEPIRSPRPCRPNATSVRHRVATSVTMTPGISTSTSERHSSNWSPIRASSWSAT